MEDCIFCKIIKGEIPSKTIYEDDLIKVFLDVNPSTNGHMLIIPKVHHTNVMDINEEVVLHSLKIIKEKLYPLLKEKINCSGLTIIQNNDLGQEVKHYHIHLYPRYNNDLLKHTYNKELLKSTDEIFNILTQK